MATQAPLDRPGVIEDAPEASTRFEWRPVKIRPAPQAQARRGAKRSSFRRLPRSDRTREITLRIVYRGGSESWWLVKARGEHGVFTGMCALEDVMRAVHSEL